MLHLNLQGPPQSTPHSRLFCTPSLQVGTLRRILNLILTKSNEHSSVYLDIFVGCKRRSYNHYSRYMFFCRTVEYMAHRSRRLSHLDFEYRPSKSGLRQNSWICSSTSFMITYFDKYCPRYSSDFCIRYLTDNSDSRILKDRGHRNRLLPQDRSEFDRYMWVLKTTSNECAVPSIDDPQRSTLTFSSCANATLALIVQRTGSIVAKTRA